MIVVDTNILLYRWLPSTQTSGIDVLIQFDSQWAAPSLWRSELRNVLAGYMRRSLLSATDAENITRQAAECLVGGEHQVADSSVFELVSRSSCTAYDCEFAALALSLNTVLVTEDRALLAAFPAFCRSLDTVVGKS